MFSIPSVRWALATAMLVVSTFAVAAEPDFAREVRPILANHCFKCHGPDDVKRQGGLRLDLRDSALAAAESGERAVVPNDANASELIKRITSSDDALQMPPASTKNPLSDKQKEILRQWIAAGAKYQAHWAFVAPQSPAIPKVKNAAWPKTPIDHFILAELEKAGFSPAGPADKYTLVRRVYLDLIGLPPTPEQADAFVNDAAPNAFEKLVDGLLQSPHYGERWARRWLDLARYADTNGYEKDRPRTMWPYRDWVIQALNDDMPFDRFTIEQLAGDMLPNPTTAQRIATGFHRNTMINEEGGIDPLEFRYYAMVDRVNTTGTTWLGLTMGCVQCHTHKYDPIPHQDFYKLMAFLDNADEPEYEVPDEKVDARRAELAKQIASAEQSLPEKFPLPGKMTWTIVRPESAVSAGKATAETLEDHSVRFSGEIPAVDTYTLSFTADVEQVTELKLEALADPLLPKNGPGRTPHGNFVLSEVRVMTAAAGAAGEPTAVKLSAATADFSQDNFPAAHAIDGDPKTGWAIHDKGDAKWNVTRTATFTLEKPLAAGKGTRWTVHLDQQHGTQHTLGRVRLSLGAPASDDGRDLETRRREYRDRKFAEWVAEERRRHVPWKQLVPTHADADVPLLTIEKDGSAFASSDQTKSDLYRLKFRSDLRNITALRLEAMPDERLPRGGPGRVYYEGPLGDFWLSDINVRAGGTERKVASATQSFASGGNNAAAALDDNKQTGWSINGGQGKTHFAVFTFAEPIADASDLQLDLLFERYYAAGLGRFRVWATTAASVPAPSALPVEVETLLEKPDASLTAAERRRLLEQFALAAPELANERQAIDKLREQMPQRLRTLVFSERPRHEPRATFVRKRGEYLLPTQQVQAELLSLFPPFAETDTHDRLAFARWLVSDKNPLAARVTMNRHWQAFFGRGLVRTTEDFGYQGEFPTHPELLDWLATEFRRQGWSQKKMHKTIVMSAAYQQSSATPADVRTRDPENKLLARFPRQRIEAELVRDNMLAVSGLLSRKIGGPSVFPPQPASVTTEGAYGPLTWNVSAGEDRYRRGMYTFAKRTAPYAMFQTFDAPSGEACVARRDVSNTPLQSLMLLNDEVFVEGAKALGQLAAAREGTLDERLEYLFRRCVTRPPTTEERTLLVSFFATQQKRLAAKELDAAALAAAGKGDVIERAAFALAARAVMNLDEAVVRP